MPRNANSHSKFSGLPKKAEELLVRANQEWELTFNAFSDLVMVLDGRHTIVRANKSMTDALGMGEEDVIGKTCFELVHGGMGPHSFCPHSRLLADGEDHSAEILEDRLGGTFEVRVSPIIDGNGRLLGSVHILRDITRRRQMEEALKQSEEQYRAVFDNAGMAIGVVGRDGRFTQANPAFLDMFGYNEFELRRLTHVDITHPDDREISEQRLDEIMRGEVHSYSLEKRYIRKDGGIIWGQLSVSTLRDPEGRPRAAVGMIADITDHKKMEIAVRESEERLRLIIDASPIGIKISQDGKYVYVNPKFVEIFGYETGDEILGLPVEAIYAPESQGLILQRVTDRTAGKRVTPHCEAIGLTKAGKRIDVAIWSTSINYFDRQAILAFVMDETESKSLRSQLFQSQKMQAVGTLAGGIAHDFNNLLTIILGFSELLLIGKHQRDPDYADLQTIQQTARNGSDLVQRILTFSRKSEIDPVPLDLNHEIEQFTKLLSRTIPKMIEIELVLSEGLATVNADPTQLEQVLMNLAVNAKDAMADGGKLTIETKNVVLDEEYCSRHLGAKPGDHVLLSVSDTGHGMDRETLSHIFEPFYTTKEIGRGTGLGLAMVYGILKQHDGHVTCDSEPGIGTTFKIYLPAMKTETKELPLTDEVELSGGTETILLVDDDKIIRDLTKRILEQRGYTALTAANGKEALNLYKKEGKRISLVILDLVMPEMSGKECLKELLKIDPRVKVLISSGYASGGSPRQAIELGAVGFVRKPYDIRQMLQVVRKIVDQNY